jgi:superoxide reductase
MNIYYCEKCGRICYTYPVDSPLDCCKEPMILLEPKKKEEGNEKHLPVVEKLGGNKISVKVGSVEHPMLEKHFIQWIFIENGDRYQIKTFNPGEKPYAEFDVDLNQPVKVYEYCNIHGLWMTELA